MRLKKVEKEIIQQWEEGRSLNVILANGYNKKIVIKTLDQYTKQKAEKWLK